MEKKIVGNGIEFSVVQCDDGFFHPHLDSIELGKFIGPAFKTMDEAKVNLFKTIEEMQKEGVIKNTRSISHESSYIQ